MPPRKFLTLEEAASMLGVSADTLSEMRDRREVSAYRDGTSWKFKSDEIERLIAERNAPQDPAAAEYAELDDDSILLSEVELGQSGPGTSSTIIGKSSDLVSQESDITIAAPKAPSVPPTQNLDLDLPLDDDLLLPADSGVLSTGSGLSAKFDDLDALDLDLPSPTESGVTPLPSDIRTTTVQVSPPVPPADDDDEIPLASESVVAGPTSVGDGGSDIMLAAPSDDDELVLGGGGSGLALSAADSGISLLDPQDSGLNLMDAPLDLGGSKASLDMGDDDDMLLLDDNKAGGAGSEDDFLLTPLDEGAEESESGSQVIALDADEVQFEDAEGLGAAPGGAVMLEEDFGESPLGASGFAAAPAAGTAFVPAASAEVPFSAWNIAGLSFVVLFLALSGMMMFDLMRNMWSWNGTYRVNSSLMDMVLSWF